MNNGKRPIGLLDRGIAMAAIVILIMVIAVNEPLDGIVTFISALGGMGAIVGIWFAKRE